MTVISSFLSLNAQTPADDPVLFSIGDDEVHVSEFNYVYEKSIGTDADYSLESIQDFLNLYKKFKLKVEDARQQGIGNDPSMQAELEMYREQLAEKYMSDHSVLKKLTEELYERMKFEVDVSHILIRLPERAPETAEAKALADLEAAKKAINSGMNFGIVAKKYSQDESVTANEGHLGFRRAKLPEGFYDLETAIYETPIGEISEPVRSRLGYHLVQVNGKRPSHGDLEIAHILIRNPRSAAQDTSRLAINRIYNKLKEGLNFKDLAQKYSQDKNTSSQGGNLGTFKAGTYAPAFEEAAYSIAEDGGFSEPVYTDFGWHIIRRISQKKLGSYGEERNSLEALIRQDSRFRLAEKALVDKIKKEENFKFHDVDPKELLDIIGEEVYGFQWKPPKKVENIALFTIRDQEYGLIGFIDFLDKNKNIRYRRSSDHEPVSAMRDMLDAYAHAEIIRFEKAHLEEKHPEFREIMREYQEGIMLFEISKNKIWDVAGRDSVGIQQFYNDHRKNYHSPRELTVDNYTVRSLNPETLEKVQKRIRKKSPEKVLKKFNKAADVIKHEEKVLQEEEWIGMFDAKKSEIKPDEVAQKTNKEAGTTLISKIRSVKEGDLLDFDEVRGIVISDYQEFLENKWVEELNKKYEIEVDESVLHSIARS